jgi:hypothetical protein
MSNNKNNGTNGNQPPKTVQQPPSFKSDSKFARNERDGYDLFPGELSSEWVLLENIEKKLATGGFRKRIIKRENNGQPKNITWKSDILPDVAIDLDISRIYGHEVVSAHDWQAVQQLYPTVFTPTKEPKTNGHATSGYIPGLPFKDDDKVELDLVLDSCTLEDLSAPRGANNKSWLDLIRLAAMLPNVRIVIPSVIADYEMRGLIPQQRLGEDGKVKYTIFDHLTEKKNSSTSIAEFLGEASRVHIDATGKAISLAGNPKIVIVESADQHQFYKDVTAYKTSRLNSYNLKNDSTPNKKTFADIYNRYKNIGEKTMLSYPNADECNHPVHFISTDMTFFSDYFSRNRNIRTQKCHEIGYTNTYGLLKAMDDACGQFPTITLPDLIDKYFGDKVAEKNADAISDKINDFRNNKSCKLFENDRSIIDLRSLTAILSQGIKMLMQERSTGGHASWGERANSGGKTTHVSV